MNKFNLTNIESLHFIGIGGISMSALAVYCQNLGVIVSGSDRTPSEKIDELKEKGIRVYIGENGENLNNIDAVCYTSAISDDNEELIEARKRGLILLKRSELLGLIAREYKTVIAVAGSHGKTTTTSILADILIKAGKNPTVFLGGENESFGNLRLGKDGDRGIILLEACEYKKNFLDITPTHTVVLNIDNDHLDSYSSVEEQIKTVEKFISPSICFANFDGKNVEKLNSSNLIKAGIKGDYPITIKNLKVKAYEQSFSVYYYGERMGRLKTKLKGIYNIYNVLMAVAISLELKIPFSFIKKAVEEFHGVERRDEFLGVYKGKNIFADYAHHPEEIKNLLESRENLRDTLIVFQPHTYSRTAFLMGDFILALSQGEHGLAVYKTYSAREKYLGRGSALSLYKKLKTRENTYYFRSLKKLKEMIDKDRKYNKIYFVGAGDIYLFAKSLVKSWAKRKKIEKN